MEFAAGANLLYISNFLSHKPRNDLCIYKSTELKSTFIEILNPNKTNVIVGCIHLYPHMDLNEYNGYYINKYSLTNEFFDSLFCHMLLLYFVQLLGTRNNSKTPNDNIYSNVVNSNNISGNITAIILDHFPHFLIAPDIFSNPPSKKLNIFESGWSKFD